MDAAIVTKLFEALFTNGGLSGVAAFMLGWAYWKERGRNDAIQEARLVANNEMRDALVKATLCIEAATRSQESAADASKDMASAVREFQHFVKVPGRAE